MSRWGPVARRRWLLVLVTVVAAGAAAYKATPRPTLYRARSTAFAGADALGFSRSTNRQGNVSVRTVAEAAVPRTPWAAAGETQAREIPGTELIAITVTDPDPRVAARLANAVPQALTDELDALVGPEPGQLPPPTAVLFEPASIPTRPVPSKTLSDVGIAVLFGLVMGAGALVLAEHLDVTVAAPADAAASTGLPLIGYTVRGT
jgi:capsular polysaccharide biosynthesis protein